MPNLEDSAEGALDISGDPPPAHPLSPKQVRGAQNRQVNRTSEQKPQPVKTAEAPSTDEAADHTAQASSEQGTGMQDYAQTLHNHAQAEGNPLAPGINWRSQQRQNPWLTYQSARRTADQLGAFMSGTGLSALSGDAVRQVEAVWGAAVDPRAISQSVNNIWEQNSVQADVAKALMTAASYGSPVGQLERLTSGHPLDTSDPTAKRVATDVAARGLPETANPLNALGLGETSAGFRLAAFAGPSLLQALASDDPNERNSALAWSGITAMLVGGRLPAPVRSQLATTLGKWPELEKVFGAIGQAKDKFSRKAGAGDSSHLQDPVQHYLDQGPFLGSVSKPGRLPKGEIPVSGKLQRAMLGKAGTSSMADFMDKAATEGITDKRLIKFIVDNYPRLGFDHDLLRINRADTALGDPRLSLRDIHNGGDPGRTGQAVESMNAFSHLLDVVHSGLWAESKDGALAVLKNLAGHNRTNGTTDLVYGRWLDTVKGLAKTHKLNGSDLSKAIWGDADAFAALPPEGQMIGRQWRLLGNALMHESKSTGYSQDFIGNWLPFMFREKATGAAAAGTGALTTTRKAHKIETLTTDAEGHLIAKPRFDSAFEANEQQALMRGNLVNELVTPSTQLRSELAKVAGAKAIKELAATDPEAAHKAARDFAKGYYGDFETDFFKIAEGWKARSLKAVRTHQALNQMTEMLGKDGNPLVVPSGRSHQFPNYASLSGRQFQGYLFHPELAGDLQRYVDHAGHGLKQTPVLKELSAIEGKTVGYIMYSPLIHAMNLSSRMGTALLMNPLEMTRYLLHGHALSPSQIDEQTLRLRTEAIESGFVPPSRGKNWYDNLSGRGNDALGHVDDQLGETPRNGQDNLWSRYQHFHQAANDFFWSWARDFGTMMYHLEKQGALKHGMSETDARMWAGQRAKTWVGLTNPEDQNPMLHDAARLVMFAPEWWKSWSQLMVPLYAKSGLSQSHRVFAAYQGAKFVAAALVMQKLTGNALNYLLTSSTPWSHDGHFQNGNLPGNQDRVEATGGWLDHLPGFNMVTATNDKTGGRRTLENPFGRQERDTQVALGLGSGHPGSILNPIQHPEDLRDGTSKMFAARLAPLADGLAATWNVDLYRTLSTGELGHVDPSNPAGPSWLSPLYAALMMSPTGSQWSQQMVQALNDPNAGQPTKGPFGATMPKSAASMLGSTGAMAERLMMSWLTGVNPPYQVAEKSRGKPVSDEGYARYQKAKQEYDQKLASYDAQVLGGQMTPAQWLQHYRSEHATYSAVAKSTFQDAPHYTNGAEGMLNAYEAIYDDPKVQNPDGSVNYDLVRQEQAVFRSDPAHSQAALSQMDQLLQQNDTKHPMLAIYHKTLDEYGKWQQGWASQHNVDLSRLHQEISEYGQLYGDRRASAHYLAQHRELALYEAAKRSQFERSPAGLMYGLLYNIPSVMAYLQARHISEQQVEQAVEGAA